ncbi:MAG TPA: preprotein translocase subunit SecY [Actinomycetota bacterium]|nr:preprotein translocase subunit SecY [Actinomycetota bacterium]
MLRAFVNAWKVKDLRYKILFTLFIIGIYRLGAHIPLPGVDIAQLHALERQASQSGGIYSLINLFSGKALTQMAVFALGIMPYITSSIIMQLLTVVIPRLEALQKEGELGQKKITQYTRYMTVVLALLQSLGIIVTANNGTLFGGAIRDLFPHLTVGRTFLIVLTLTAGTSLIMWLGETITQRGIGNGMSLLIFASIIAGMPGNATALWASAGPGKGTVFIALGLLIVVAVVLVEQAQRRIPVQYAKRVVGRKTYGGASTYIPMKVNQAGVIPIIFASSLLYLPVLASTIIHNAWLTRFVDSNLSNQNHISWWYVGSYFVLIIFFTYFYTAITFNPADVADNMKKYGGFIPGIRPGKPTSDYLSHILTRITLPGAMFLGAIAVLPFIAQGAWKVSSFPFAGTAVLIMVGVALETMKQIESQLMMRHYEGFLK